MPSFQKPLTQVEEIKIIFSGDDARILPAQIGDEEMRFGADDVLVRQGVVQHIVAKVIVLTVRTEVGREEKIMV